MSHSISVYRPQDLPQGKTALIFAPHPDDTSICAGGAAALLAEKNRVVSVVMTTGHRAAIPNADQAQRIAERERESLNEAKELGAECVFLKLPLYDSGKIEAADVSTINNLLEDTRPDLIFLPNMQDPHPTHALCRDAILQALRSYTVLHAADVELWHYESPWSLFNREDYNAVLSLPDAVLQKKMQAIRAHASQTARTRYDDLAFALGRMRAVIVPEQSLAGYGKSPDVLDDSVEMYCIVRMGHQAKLVESLSGVRGIYQRGLTPEVAREYGYAFGSWLKHTIHVNPKVVVGMDTRASGPTLKRALIEGLTRAHCHIFDIGVATTPLTQFEVRNRKSDGGVIITASHNEPHWNGFKFLWNDGATLTEDHMRQVIAGYHAEVREIERPYSDHYLYFLLDWLGKETLELLRERRFKIVVDPNGGAIVVLLQKLLDILGVEVIAVNMRPGEFAHQIEPTAAALAHLAPLVQEHQADCGVAWDCDGDRLEIMLPDGNLLSGHSMLALLAWQMLKHLPPQKDAPVIVVNGATSQVVQKVAERFGARVIETDVGESNVVAEMKRVNALMGGEGSSGGGIIPPSRCRDGMMTLLKVMQLMAEERKTLQELVAELPTYCTRSANIYIRADRISALHAGIALQFPLAQAQRVGGDHGGTKLRWPDEKFLWMRESKTEQNLMRVFVDGNDAEWVRRTLEAAVAWVQQEGNAL